ncbi:hypothetical protein DFJ74DRAFT_665405 [Hyaloraphidium curvatum]|nr:hypothetical protein DFJ74DRAFT_665405 [Hyaloraphidium curvatum]
MGCLGSLRRALVAVLLLYGASAAVQAGLLLGTSAALSVGGILTAIAAGLVALAAVLSFCARDRDGALFCICAVLPAFALLSVLVLAGYSTAQFVAFNKDPTGYPASVWDGLKPSSQTWFEDKYGCGDWNGCSATFAAVVRAALLANVVTNWVVAGLIVLCGVLACSGDEDDGWDTHGGGGSGFIGGGKQDSWGGGGAGSPESHGRPQDLELGPSYGNVMTYSEVDHLEGTSEEEFVRAWSSWTKYYLTDTGCPVPELCPCVNAEGRHPLPDRSRNPRVVAGAHMYARCGRGWLFGIALTCQACNRRAYGNPARRFDQGAEFPVAVLFWDPRGEGDDPDERFVQLWRERGGEEGVERRMVLLRPAGGRARY